MGKSLVIVESPAKARTIEKYLGPGFQVEASVGHIRDLPRNASEVPAARKKDAWARLGVNVDADFEPLYVVPAEKKAQVKMLRDALRGADALYLATDEDREGESISWHLLEVLKPKKGVPVYRLVFHEITKPAIQRALANPREVDLDLVRAQEARRIVDRLFGYEVSPLLWRKIRPQLSAGRVQSVAVRLVVERERARVAFRSAVWWDVVGSFSAKDGLFEAGLVEFQGQRVASGRNFDDQGNLKGNKVRVLDEATVQGIVAGLKGGDAHVGPIEEKPYADRPAPPFTTSTLQQEANRKLRWTARRTMNAAQGLYETGWITYMRTDSVTLSTQAVDAARALISENYGAAYLPKSPRIYKSKAKNAQEAHEAIRPAGERFRELEQARGELGGDATKLYELIWKRTVASQMANATGKTISVRVSAGECTFQARGKTIEFAGFRRAYVEGSDRPETDISEKERLLPNMKTGEVLGVDGLEPKGHETQPPARLTEASLVKELEARGIGRPSTYASIIETILRRAYVFKKGTALVPTFTAFAVTNLLETHLSWLVDYDFTAQMESQLDDIAIGKGDRAGYLSGFFLGNEGLRDRLAAAAEGIDPRTVCTIPVGIGEDGEQIDIRVGRYGPFLSSGELKADIPEDLPPDELTLAKAQELLDDRKEGPRNLGIDPTTEMPVFLMKGRFGPYIQLGESPEDKKEKPKRASLLRGMEVDAVDLSLALQLLSLPRELGMHPETNEPVTAANGRFGPYVRSGKTSRSLPADVSVLVVGLDAAVTLLKEAPKRRRAAEPMRVLGVDESTEREVKIMKGRFGPYITDGETNVSLRRGETPEEMELSIAIEKIRLKEVQPKRPKRTRKPAAKKPAAKKPAAKKPAAKKPAAKKPAAKKPAAKTTTARKPAAKKTTAARKPAAKKTTAAGETTPTTTATTTRKPAAKKAPSAAAKKSTTTRKPAAKKTPSTAAKKTTTTRKSAAKKTSTSAVAAESVD